MSEQPFQVIGEIILHKAHALAERTRDRVRILQRRYQLPRKVLEELETVGSGRTDESNRE
jgi:hypothetical protein